MTSPTFEFGLKYKRFIECFYIYGSFMNRIKCALLRKHVLGTHYPKSEYIKVHLPAFKRLFVYDDILIKSITKTITHEYLHYVFQLHFTCRHLNGPHWSLYYLLVLLAVF